MNVNKTYTGHCIAQDREYSFTVKYLDDGQGGYIRDLIDCTYRGLHRPEICRECSIVKKITPQP